MRRFLFVAPLIAHGLVHLLGFVVNWQLASLAEMPYKTTLLAGALDVGATGIRAVGLLWLLGPSDSWSLAAQSSTCARGGEYSLWGPRSSRWPSAFWAGRMRASACW